MISIKLDCFQDRPTRLIAMIDFEQRPAPSHVLKIFCEKAAQVLGHIGDAVATPEAGAWRERDDGR